MMDIAILISITIAVVYCVKEYYSDKADARYWELHDSLIERNAQLNYDLGVIDGAKEEREKHTLTLKPVVVGSFVPPMPTEPKGTP